MKHLFFSLIVLFPLTVFANPPAGWRCPPSFYNDGWCDCGCGVVDADCNNPSTPLWNNCSNGYTCGRQETTCYAGGVRSYWTQAFGGTFDLDHTYPCRVESANVKASYCELDNVWGSCPTTSDSCPESWIGDGWCDPPCVNKYGHDGGDCALPQPTQFKCIGQYASGVQSAQTGGGLLGTTYFYDPWFAMGGRNWNAATMKNKYDYIAYENGSCDIWYLIDGVCHQQTNRTLWLSHAAPKVSQYNVKGSSLSEGMYGVYGGGWSSCRSEIGAN